MFFSSKIYFRISASYPTLFKSSLSRFLQEAHTIQKITTVFENGSTEFQYGYAENLHDGRGITFGFFGLTSGTYDGTLFLEEYQRLNSTNRLVKYIEAFNRIDSLEHSDDGIINCVDGLEGFIEDFQKCVDDPLFIQAQHTICDLLYWEPAIDLFKALGAQLPITLGQLYDTCIQHGVDGCISLIEATSAEKGELGIQVEEREWLGIYLSKRILVLRKSGQVWKESIDRVKCYQRLLRSGLTDLCVPLSIEVFGSVYVID